MSCIQTLQHILIQLPQKERSLQSIDGKTNMVSLSLSIQSPVIGIDTELTLSIVMFGTLGAAIPYTLLQVSSQQRMPYFPHNNKR